MMYEWMKEFVIAGACGMILAIDIFGIYYWIKALVLFIRKKIKGHKEDKIATENQQ
jgi:hypothetical protein